MCFKHNSLIILIIVRVTLYLALSFTINATTIYKWVDKNGVTHFSQERPQDIAIEVLDSKSIEPKKIGTVAIKSKTELTPEFPSHSDRSKQQDDELQSKAICNKAKHNLKVLSSHTNLLQKSATTNKTTTMTEEQRQAAITEQKKRIMLFCR
ncbi:MAG: DUF4124 domain-containing protein [Parashewanella sp.]